MNHSTLTASQKLIIEKHKEEIIELKHFKKIDKFLKEKNIEILQKELFDFLYPEKIIKCSDAKFISLSVGYRTCKKGCVCYTENLSKKLKDIKDSYSDNEKAIILEKRKETNLTRYGVECVFLLDDIKEKTKNTKILTYGNESYNNRDKAKSTSIDKYGVENPAQSIEIKYRTLCTNNDRYGADSPLQSKEIQEKSKKTLLARYGHDNPMQVASIREKIKNTNLQKYGVENPAHSDHIKTKIKTNLRQTLYQRMVLDYKEEIVPLFTEAEYINGKDYPWECTKCRSILNKGIINGIIPRCITCYPYSTSMFEKDVRNYISSIFNGELLYNLNNIIAPYEIDIFVPKLNFAIECNGVYRHTEISGMKDKTYHLNKTKMCQERGISLLHITDIQWYNKNNIVKSIIKNKIGLSNKVYARQCYIKVLHDRDTVVQFLNNNHLQGYVNHKVALGLYSNDTLVSVMTFSKPRFSVAAEWELLRFCNLAENTVIGGASKLLKYFTKTYNAKSVLSYSDKSYGISSFYEKLNFNKTHTTSPNYFYYKNGVLYNRLKFQKHKLHKILEKYDANLTEWENMMENGYDRLWDCGNDVWVLTL